MRLLRRIGYWLRHSRLQSELGEEIEFHRAQSQARLERDGIPHEHAAQASRRRMGNVTLASEDARSVWMPAWIDHARQDVHYALRTIRRSPGFAVTMIAVMALGIGSTSAVFGLIDGLVLRSLPVRDAHRLAYLSRPSFSYPIFKEVEARGSHIFSQLFAWNLTTVNVRWSTQLERTEVLMASGEFYSTLGIVPALGRLLTAEDDRTGGGRDGLVAVVSHACWMRRFGGDRSVVGRTIDIDRRLFTIVGVAPAAFFGVAPGLAPEITIPLTTLQDGGALRQASTSWLHLMGRVRDGLTLERANAALQSIWPAVLDATTDPGTPADRRAMYLSRTTSLESARAGYSRVRNQFGEPLWVLLALAALLLTIAAATAANLLLARGVARQREFAVRAAIGAGRWRVVRQMLTEAVFWTALGGAAGLGLAWWGANALIAMMMTSNEPIVLDVSPNVRIASFALALALVTAVVSAVAPALRATRVDVGTTLKESAQLPRRGSTRRWSAGRLLVTTQVAFAVVLLFGAALFVRSLQSILAQDAGFDRKIVVVSTDAVAAGYSGPRLAAFHAQLRERLAATPGVESAALSWYPPISDEDGAWTQSVAIDGGAIVQDPTRYVHFNAITPGYFRTLGTRLIHGRDFDDRDRAGAKPVTIVSESFVRRFFPDAVPLGRLVTVGRDARRRNLEVVGIVSDAKYQRLQEPTRRIAYMPLAQLPASVTSENLVAELRLAESSTDVAESVRREIRALDGAVPVRIQTVADRIRESLVVERAIATLATALGLAALALACAGLYGLLAFMVSRQTGEIGLRMALGADRIAILWMVLRHSVLLAAGGIAIGVAGSLALGRFARNLLYDVSPTDPLSLVVTAAAMLVVAAGAALVPARRAANMDPVAALRD